MSSSPAGLAEIEVTPERFDGVAFDLDGVLTKTALVHEAAWKQVFDTYLKHQAALDGQAFVPFGTDDYRRYVDGRPRDDGIRIFLESRGHTLPEGGADDGPEQDTVQGLGRRKNRLFAELLKRDGVETYPHAARLLRQLHTAGIRTAVVSASKNCAAVLQAAGIAELFDVRVDGLTRDALHLRGKPAPDTFLEAARQLDCDPVRVMVVEDALAGVEAGRAGGFGLVVGVDRNEDPQALKAHGADIVIRDLAQIRVPRANHTHGPSTPNPPQGPAIPSETAAPCDGLLDEIEAGPWVLSYESFDPVVEGQREALFALGNGYVGTRGAAAESVADGVHYPGTYLAGGYNRQVSRISGRPIEHEDLVNWPNWLPIAVRLANGASGWLDTKGGTEIVQYRQDLDLRRGLYRRIVRFRDRHGRVTRLEERRFVHMREKHLAGIHLRVVAENWSGLVTVCSALDGRVTNAGVLRYRTYDGRHIQVLDTAAPAADVILLEAETRQSRIRLVEAARTRLYRDGQAFEPERRVIREPGWIGQEMTFHLGQAESVDVEKIVAIYTSRDRAITEPRTDAVTTVTRADRFAVLYRQHALAWVQIWRFCDLEFLQVEGEADDSTHRIVRLHLFHILQTASLHAFELDVGVPARGWTGEGYRGHIFWDELFIFPYLILRLPKLTRSLLMYRWRRLPEARWAAREAGYRGAMFPWQSGSNGREETDTMYFNPRSGSWIRDNSHLQRHVNAAIVYNIWHYHQATADLEFLYICGAELMLEIARFWSSIAKWNPERGRYEIRGVVGPDEFHDGYPGSAAPGVDNNAYTNVMAAWCLERALRLFDILPNERCRVLCDTLRLDQAELTRWDEISRKMFVPFHDDGIISQFEGYETLQEFDWDGYRQRYGNIMRLDLVLEAENDTPNRYKLSKQADVLMLFYLFSCDSLIATFARLGYAFDGSMIRRNIDYYLERTSHGSTLSSVVHAWVLARSSRRDSWALFRQALRSDIEDIQGGTTAEGIHLGAMAGTIDLLQRCYSGLDLRGDELWFEPRLPDELDRLRFQLRYRGHSLRVDITDSSLEVMSDLAAGPPITIGMGSETRSLAPGGTVRFGTVADAEKPAAQMAAATALR